MPVFLKNKISDSAVAGLWYIAESEDELLSLIRLTDYDKDYLQRFKNEPRRKHWLASRILIQELFQKEHSIIYNTSGKPYEKNNIFQLSISHSGNFAAVIIDTINPTGIDIERKRKNIESVIHKYLSENEIANISAKLNYIEKYHIYWCAKESLYKLSGKEGLIFNEEIIIQDFNLNTEGYFNAFMNNIKYRLFYKIIDDYFLTYVT